MKRLEDTKQSKMLQPKRGWRNDDENMVQINCLEKSPSYYRNTTK